MKALIVFLLSLLIVLDVKADYSIDTFLEYMQQKGYYDIIAQIKEYFWDDVAIEFCKELVQSNDCEQLVKIYINIPGKTRGQFKETKKLTSIVFYPDNYNIYKDNELYFHNIIETIENKFDLNSN